MATGQDGRADKIRNTGSYVVGGDSMGHMAILLAGSRYMNEMKELSNIAESGEITKADAVLTSTYLLGLIDMATLYLGVRNDKDLASHLRRIDAKVMGFKSGSFADSGDVDSGSSSEE